MQPDDFLGGKYQQSEQILPGPLQTFRAHESSTGRPVFVHRMSTTEDPAQQILLLRLLSLALMRSASARSLILDLSDEAGFWYVVTQSEPQCLALREWLQFEIYQASGEREGPAKRETVEAEMPRSAAAVEVKPTPAAAAPLNLEPAKPEAPQQEPGEFTRFFQGGLPAAKKSAQPEPLRGRDRPSNPDLVRGRDRPTRISGFVQRPNTPLPPSPQQPPPRASEPGEFTKAFSRPPIEGAGSTPKSYPAGSAPGGTAFPGSSDFGAGSPNVRSLPDAGGGTSEPPDMFSTAAGMPTPAAQPAKEPGEYTRIFGKDNAPTPQQPSSVATQRFSTFDDPLARNRPSATPGTAPPAAKGPSEYTQVMQGARVQPPSPEGVAQKSGDAAPAGLPGIPPMNVAVPNPMHMPVPAAKAPVLPQPPALPQATVAAPTVANKKLIIFFLVLAALAILLVIVFVIATKK